MKKIAPKVNFYWEMVCVLILLYAEYEDTILQLYETKYNKKMF